MTKSPLSLPLVTDEPTASWHGFAAAAPLPTSAEAAPEPDAPQGEYGSTLPVMTLQLPLPSEPVSHPVELLAPAGGPEAGFAALRYGADAIYLGLQKFSARAEAENFSLDELDEIVAFAHSLTPRRRVFVTINTLIRQDELAEVIDNLAVLVDLGIDAVILQDLGVYHLIRQHFPELELHASTQLAVHNRAGADVLRQLGFARVVLARELTFEEVRDITAAAQIETEVFIHGALCYSYSGLCLFSAQTMGRSGNRGKCSYSCRDSFTVTGAPETLRDGEAVKRDPTQGFPFSMKDLALPDHLPALRGAGVSCFKVEGRKKGPLYVATTTDYYRRLLDGGLSSAERRTHEADMQTVFSRPWTSLFVQSHRDKEVADRDTVGHRGTRIGSVEAIRNPGTSTARLRFRTARPLEKHDGIQVDLPVLGKPFGFAVERLWVLSSGQNPAEEVFDAPAKAHVEVALPADYPNIPVGAPVYCSSSQAVKQSHRLERPKPGAYRVRSPLQIEAWLTRGELRVTGRVPSPYRDQPAIERSRSLPGPFTPARDPETVAAAFRAAFAKLGDTRLQFGELTLHNPEGLFVPISRLNALRRELTPEIEAGLREAVRRKASQVKSALLPRAESKRISLDHRFRWSLKIDRLEAIDAFEPADWDGVDELIVDIARDQPALLLDRLTQWAGQIGKERIRLALPALTRKWEEKGIAHKVERLRAAGWSKWEAANLSAWGLLGIDPMSPSADLDLSADWSIYVINRAAALQLEALGVRRFTLSPEDGLANLRSLLTEFGPRATLIVYQDTPLFLAESCAYANLIGGCPGKANCKFESMEMVSSDGERVTALDYHCRTIVLNQGPFCLSPRLPELADAGAVSLRADFIYRRYEPSQVRDLWRTVRQGRPVPGGHAANFERGLQ